MKPQTDCGMWHVEVFSDFEKHCFGIRVRIRALVSGLKGEGRKKTAD